LDTAKTPDEDLDHQAVQLKIAEKNPATLADDDLNIRSDGAMIPQAAVFDLKTPSGWRSAKAHYNHYNVNFKSEYFLPRLWMSQTPNFILAHHQRGFFDKIEIMDVRKRVRWRQTDNDELLGRLHALLKQLESLCAGVEMSRLEIRISGKGKLEIRPGRKKWSALPQDF
jgi:hypothetical protein